MQVICMEYTLRQFLSLAIVKYSKFNFVNRVNILFANMRPVTEQCNKQILGIDYCIKR